jgi:hypothetical protein
MANVKIMLITSCEKGIKTPRYGSGNTILCRYK